ncbi:MAG: shikimate kinase [Nannocystaceae bacterium]
MKPSGPSGQPPAWPVFLCGMMGSGKSTLAPRLAEAWSAPWVDLDRRVESIFGRTIADLFAAGEPAFRRREAAALRSLLAEPGVRARTLVVATGGGTIVDPQLRTLMSAVGTVVHLKVSIDGLVARLRQGGGPARPLLAGDVEAVRARLQALADARASAYASADVVVDGEADPQDVLCRLREALEGGEAS